MRSLSDFPRSQRIASLGLRAVIVVLLIAAACGPILLRATDQQLLIFAVDRSESIDDTARTRADEFIAEALAANSSGDVEIQFMEFTESPGDILREWPPPSEMATGEGVAVSASNSEDTGESPADELSTDAADAGSETDADDDSGGTPEIAETAEPIASDSSSREPAPRRGTNVTAALRTAMAAMPPSRVPRIVLLSDGNPTEGGDARALVAEAGVPVWTVPLPVRSEPEVQLTRVQAPTQVRQGQPFYVEVIVSSNHDTQGYIDLYRGDIRIGEETTDPVSIRKGENRFRFRQSVQGKRQQTFAARLRGFEDTLLDNNESSTVVYAEGRPRVLLIDPDVDQTDSLRWALDEQSIDVEVRPPEGIPRDLGELQGYECLVLSNVAATVMSMRQMDLIRIYVQDLGGGFIMLGGDESFGLGGYYRTQIEEILPVRSNFEKEREKPSLAMMLVVDKSGSMGGQKIELAKDAARAAVELLSPRDAVGVIAFDGQSYVVSELRTAADQGAITDAISTIEASGGTNMYPAMVDAFDALVGASARLKHVIMMTDGVSTPGDFEGAAGDMAASRITLSTVALGEGASGDLLEELAQIGGGRYYFCDSAESVPQVFAKETVEASKSAINELPFVPQLVRPTSVLEGIDPELAPLLLGYVVTRPKPTAEFILASEVGDPLLVWWRYGLGMSVAFTSDAKSRWAAEWLSWPDFGTFWAQIIRHAMRKDESRGIYVEVDQQGDQARITMDAVDELGRFIDDAETTLTMIDPRLRREQLTLQQTAPGRFEATVPTPQRGDYHIDLAQRRTDGSAVRSSRGVTVGYSDELRLLPPGESLLQQIASLSNGRYDPAPEAVLEPDERSAREPHPLWPWLLMTAMVIFVADVALRRIEVWPDTV